MHDDKMPRLSQRHKPDNRRGRQDSLGLFQPSSEPGEHLLEASWPWVGSRGEIVTSEPGQCIFVQQNQRFKFDIHLHMASTFNPNGPLSSGSQGLTYFFHQQHLYINSKHSSVNPIWPGSFWCIRDPLNIFGLGGVRVLLFGNDFPRHDLPYSKGFMKFGWQEPSKKMFPFWNFCSSKRCLTQFIRVLPNELWYFWRTLFFQQNEQNLRGKKGNAFFLTHNWENSSFFNALVRVFALIYANTWQGGQKSQNHL